MRPVDPKHLALHSRAQILFETKDRYRTFRCIAGTRFRFIGAALMVSCAKWRSDMARIIDGIYSGGGWRTTSARFPVRNPLMMVVLGVMLA